jgi:hypothetical protein
VAVQCASFAWADPEEIIPIDDIIPIEELEPLCKPNHNSSQMSVTKDHLQAIRDAVRCGDLLRAQDVSMNLAHYLHNEVANGTPRGHCFDDRACTSVLALTIIHW